MGGRGVIRLKYVHAFRDRTGRMASHASSTDKKSEYEKIRRENLNWIIAQGDEQRGFATKFAPFLVQREGKRPWWLGIS
jgi:hypothetical protein